MGPEGDTTAPPFPTEFYEEENNLPSAGVVSTENSPNMAGDDETYKIQEFNGKASDDYNTWRLSAVIALKGKGFWQLLKDKKVCSEDVKDKAAALLVNSLGDSPLRVCSSSLDELLKILELLDARYASGRTVTRISVLTSLY